VKESRELNVEGRLLECSKCKRKILIEYALSGVKHCLGIIATCWDCLGKGGRDKATEVYGFFGDQEPIKR
jgi:hypothetical protein